VNHLHDARLVAHFHFLARAAELATILAGRTAMLNVIPYNPVAGLPYATPSPAAQRAFRQTLESRGVNVHFRHRKGDAIDAACGQLRRRSQPALNP
jgi:23S rRNA (adenine2503-C2)-methyltransferase